MVSYTIVHTDTKSDFTFNLLPPINLKQDTEYEAALMSINLYNSIPNLTHESNNFKYSSDNGITWKNIIYNTGSYEIKAINSEIQRYMINNGDFNADDNEFYITLSADIPELKSIINITNPLYIVDFNIETL